MSKIAVLQVLHDIQLWLELRLLTWIFLQSSGHADSGAGCSCTQEV